eukprot:8315692-Pyramimonas_sp.AAC.1
MFSRTWSRAREDDVRSWSQDSEPAWDAAVAGNSALREAFARALKGEAMHNLGIAFGEGLVDIK